MFKALREFPVLTRASVAPSNHRQVMQRYDEQLIRLLWHYRRAVHVVPNEHIIVQLLRHAGVAYAGNDELYYNSVSAQVNRIATALKINTSVHANGAQPRSSFYGSNVNEFIVAVTPPFVKGIDYDRYWPSAQPIRVRYHPYSDLSFNLPDNEGVAPGYAVIEVNIPLLMLQFLKWKAWTETRYEHKPSVQQFVFQFPLVNMLSSHADVCWMNRLVNKQALQPNRTDRKRFGLALNDISGLVDKDQEIILERMLKMTLSAVEVGQVTPMAIGSTLWDFALPPAIDYTRQNAVYHLLGCMPWLSFMAKVSFQTNSQDNRPLAYLVEQTLRTWSKARWFNQPDVDADHVSEFMAESVLRYLVA